MEESNSRSSNPVGIDRRSIGKIRVTGGASISVEADFAELELEVETLELTVSSARSSAARAMTEVLMALSSAGIADDDVRTGGLSIQPAHRRHQYDNYRTTAPEGFYVSNSLQVRIRDLEAIGSVIDDAVEAGRDLIRVGSISFGIDNCSMHKDKLIDDAVASATAKAHRLADLTGVTLGKPTSISFGQFGEVHEVAYSPSTEATPIRVGGVEVNVDVCIEFAIE